MRTGSPKNHHVVTVPGISYCVRSISKRKNHLFSKPSGAHAIVRQHAPRSSEVDVITHIPGIKHRQGIPGPPDIKLTYASLKIQYEYDCTPSCMSTYQVSINTSRRQKRRGRYRLVYGWGGVWLAWGWLGCFGWCGVDEIE